MFDNALGRGYVDGNQVELIGSGDSYSARRLGFYGKIKRVVDIVVCIAAAPAASLVIAATALLILIFMGRPILFSQSRVGLDGRAFRMFKLRTMISGDPMSRDVGATLVGDPRVTALGRVLRRSHLDELPQLWNVLRADMTLIGPRPEQPHLVESYAKLLPNYDLRHSVRPGLSGWAQVRYGYAADAFETEIKLRYDLYYVRNFGLALDLKIVFLTMLVFMNRRYVR